MRIISVLTLAVFAFVIAGCATPRSEPLPEGPKGEAIVELTRSMRGEEPSFTYQMRKPFNPCPLLINADESPAVRVASALALGKIGNRYPDIELIDSMRRDPSIQVKIAAIRSLAQIGGERAFKALDEYNLEYSNSKIILPEKAVLEELKNALNKARESEGK